MGTAADMITRAMRLANILGEGQTPSGDQSTNALSTLNEMLSAWNLDDLMLYQTTNDVVATVIGQSVYTVGTGGDWSVDRPVQINSMYQVYQGVSFPVDEVNQDEYNQITLKTLTQPLQRFFLYLNTHPLGTCTLWPTPTTVNAVYISVNRVLANIATLATTITLPPGYDRAVRANLAVELCPEYGREPQPSLAKAAKESKADIKRANHVPVLSEYDSALIPAPGGLAAFLSGY